jgi:hypothetical protein
VIIPEDAMDDGLIMGTWFKDLDSRESRHVILQGRDETHVTTSLCAPDGRALTKRATRIRIDRILNPKLFARVGPTATPEMLTTTVQQGLRALVDRIAASTGLKPQWVWAEIAFQAQTQRDDDAGSLTRPRE